MNYAQELHRKLTLHSETDFIDIKEDIDTLIDLADKAISEIEDLSEEKDDEIDLLKDKVEDLEEEMEDEPETSTSEWGLLGEQIKEAFDEIMTNPKTNQIKFLQHLTDINNGKIKLQ